MDEILDSRSIEVLNDILSKTIRNTTEIHLKQYRMSHIPDLERIQGLISGDFLTQDMNQQNCRLSATGLFLANSPDSNALLTDIDLIIEHLREHLKTDIGNPASLSNISNDLGLTRSRTEDCLTYLRNAYSLAGTTDLTDQNAHIFPSEGLFNFNSLGDLLTQRLQSRFPDHFQSENPDKKRHGNIEISASKREQILSAALYVLAKHPNKCKHGERISGAKIAEQIEIRAELWWPESGEPPLGNRKIRDIINKSLNTR